METAFYARLRRRLILSEKRNRRGTILTFTFYIKIHNIIYVISFIRYRIQLKVQDSLGMATFILFDSEAEKLPNILAKDLLNKSLEVRMSKIKLVFNIY